MCVYHDERYALVFRRLNDSIGMLRFATLDSSAPLDYVPIPSDYTLRHISMTPQPCVILEGGFIVSQSENYELIHSGKVVLRITNDRVHTFCPVVENGSE